MDACFAVNLYLNMEKHEVLFKDLGLMNYQSAWDLQEKLLQENVRRKSIVHGLQDRVTDNSVSEFSLPTQHHLLFVEHTPVYTLGKSGNKANVLLGDDELKEKNIQFFNTNRAGDITLHGNAEFFAKDVVFEGDLNFEVLDGHCLTARQKGEKTIWHCEKIESSTWQWKYTFDEQNRVILSII